MNAYERSTPWVFTKHLASKAMTPWDVGSCLAQEEAETGVQSFTSNTEIAPESSPDSTVGSDARSIRSNGRLGLADRVVKKYLGCTNCTTGPI